MEKLKYFIQHPRKSLFTLALPIIIAMLVQTLYDIVDIAFVGRLGAEPLAAMTFSFPIFFILIAINSGITAGMSSLIARYLGAKKKKDAENAALHGIVFSIVLAILVTIIGFVFSKQIFALFGATGNVLVLSTQYMNIILLGSVFMFVAYVYNGILSSEGDTKTPMYILVASLVVNAVLNYFLIFRLGLGIRGSAWATFFAFLMATLLFIIFAKRKSYLCVSLRCFRFSWKILKEIISVGAPATLMITIISVYVIFLNRLFVHFGNEYVGMFGIVSTLENVATVPMIGFATALVTLVGMFYGAKRYDLVKSISWYGVRVALLVTAFLGVVFFLFAGPLLRIFTTEKNIVAIGIPYVHLDVFTIPLMGMIMVIGRVMQAVGKGMPGLAITLIRIFVVAIPLAYLFVHVFFKSYLWIAVAMIIGGSIASIIGLLWLAAYFKKLNRKSPLPSARHNG